MSDLSQSGIFAAQPSDPNKPIYDARGKFIGDNESQEHHVHRAYVATQDADDSAEYSEAVDTLDARINAYPAAWRRVKLARGVTLGTPAAREFNPANSRIGDVFSKPPAPPPFVVDRLLPRAHGVENAIGGAGKTTRHLWEALHVILGRELYGQRVLQPGPVLFISKEDDADLFRHRIHEIVANMPDLTAADRKRIADHLHVLVLTGKAERLVKADRQGNLEPTDLAERIIRGYSREGLALVEFDPFNLLGAGERYVNDGEAETLSTMANVAQELKCAVRATSHVSKAVGREGTSDAHSGRGGSAGGDNSRFVFNYWRFDSERDKGVVPAELTSVADAGELYRLHVAKLTAARSAFDRVWIVRQGFSFRWHTDALVTPQAQREATADADAQQVFAYLLRGREQDGFHTATELGRDAATIGIGRDRVRAAVRRLLARGRVVEKDLPNDPGLRKGGRKTYLEPVPEPVAALDTSKPIAEQIGLLT